MKKKCDYYITLQRYFKYIKLILYFDEKPKNIDEIHSYEDSNVSDAFMFAIN